MVCPQRCSASSDRDPFQIIRLGSGLRGNAVGREEQLENLIRKQSPAARQANAIAGLLQQSIAKKTCDRRTQAVDCSPTEGSSNVLQIDSPGQTQSEKETFFQRTRSRNGSYDQGRARCVFFQGIGGR